MVNTTQNLIVASLASATALAAIAFPMSQTVQAQVTINSSGLVSGTVVPPDINPNFNRGTTRIEVDAQGRYFRVGTTNPVYIAPDPNLVRMADDGTFFVDFRGIPVVGIAGTLTSPVLSDGQLDSAVCCNHRAEPVFFNGTIQDEFVVLGTYTGTATDPATGEQYQGTFDIRGQGPRYSDRDGGTSPTVFDFQSHYNFAATPQLLPTPTVDSFTFQDMPVQLRVTVPSGLSPVTPTTPVTPATPATSTTSVTPTTAVTPSTPVSPPTSPTSPTPSLPAIAAVVSASEITATDYVLLQESRQPQAEAQPSNFGPRSRVMLWQ